MLSRLSTFKRGFVSTFGLDVISRGVSAIATVLFVRALGVESFAYVILFLNLGQFTGSALTGGIRMRYMRVEAERVSRGDPQPTGFAFAWGASLVLVISVAALSFAGATLAEVGNDTGDRLLFVGLTAGFTVGHASIELAMYHYQAHLRFVRAGVAGATRNIAILVVAVAATAGLIEDGQTIAAWVVAGIIAVALVTCVPIAIATRKARSLSSLRGDFGRESGWLTVYYLTSAGFAYASMFVVAALLNDEAVASYGAALRYTSIVMGPTPALLAIIRIRTSQSDIIDSTQRQTAMMLAWIKRATLPVAAVLSLAALAAPFAIPLIDDGRYPNSIPIFQLLLIGALVSYATMPSANLLMSKRRYQLLAGVYALALVIEVGAVALAAELSGVVAVAGATSLVGSVEASLVAYLATRVSAAAPRADAALPQASGGD